MAESELLKSFSPGDDDHREKSHQYQAKMAKKHPAAEIRHVTETDTYEVWSGPRAESSQVSPEIEEALERDVVTLRLEDADVEKLTSAIAEKVFNKLLTLKGLTE